MTQLNNSIVSKVKDGLIVALSVAVLFVAGFSGNFTKPAVSETIPGLEIHQYEGAGLLPIGGGDGGGFDGD